MVKAGLNISRRAAFAGAIASPTIARSGNIRPADALLLFLGRRYDSLDEQIEGLDLDAGDYDRRIHDLVHRQGLLAQQMAELPTRTADGAHLKLRITAQFYDAPRHVDGWDARLFDQVLSYLQRAR